MAEKKNGSIIKATDFTDLKAKVKAECARRKYVGSVANYASSSWDYNTTPATGKIVSKEHYTKLIEPLLAINNKVLVDGQKVNLPSASSTRIVDSDNELYRMDTLVTLLATRTINNHSATDCNSQCTGTCTASCVTDCLGTCSDGCSGCGSGCETSCYGSCANYCSVRCSSGCQNGCGNSCAGDCQTWCYTSCSSSATTCPDGCTNNCMGACSECASNCQSQCGYYCGQTCRNDNS